MNRTLLLISSLAIAMLILASVSQAVPPGRNKVWKGGGVGKVIFSSTDHDVRGWGCIKCHPDIFIMKGDAVIKMVDIYDGRYCGKCHNGVDGFDARKQENCGLCHK